MNKILLDVPLDVKYINQWKEFETLLPPGQIVLNKVYPGCGMTTYFLESPSPVILAAPRRFLLDNKAAQMEHDGQHFFYYQPSTKHHDESRKKENSEIFRKLMRYIDGCYVPGDLYVPKILVTYDSLPIIYEKLKGSGIDFTLVVDEFHVCFQDYNMKRETLERFFSVTQMMKEVIYLSATPIMENYLDRMETFNRLPYVELIWDASRVSRPNWQYKQMRTTIEAATQIIQDYKQNGIFDSLTTPDRIAHNSTEAVFFINDVSNIIQIIKKNDLNAEDVNILVSDSNNDNLARIHRHLGTSYGIGSIPLRDEPHKTYTFCSKSTFFGCDFYSTNASTYVFADANRSNMATDIALELPQIAGRQRLEGINLFRDRITIFVKCAVGGVESYQDYQQKQKEKETATDKICQEWGKLGQEALAATKVNQQACPYGVIYQDPSDNNAWKVKKSINAIVAEERAWELRNAIYRDHQTFTYLLMENGYEVCQYQQLFPDEIHQFCYDFRMCSNASQKMQMYCQFFDCHPECLDHINRLDSIPAEYKNCYRVLGSAAISQYGYDMNTLCQMYDEKMTHGKIAETISPYFQIGSQYAKKQIKTLLQKTYDHIGLQRTAKATDITEYYTVKDSVKVNNDGTRTKTFKIISRL